MLRVDFKSEARQGLDIVADRRVMLFSCGVLSFATCAAKRVIHGRDEEFGRISDSSRRGVAGFRGSRSSFLRAFRISSCLLCYVRLPGRRESRAMSADPILLPRFRTSRAVEYRNQCQSPSSRWGQAGVAGCNFVSTSPRSHDPSLAAFTKNETACR